MVGYRATHLVGGIFGRHQRQACAIAQRADTSEIHTGTAAQMDGPDTQGVPHPLATPAIGPNGQPGERVAASGSSLSNWLSSVPLESAALAKKSMEWFGGAPCTAARSTALHPLTGRHHQQPEEHQEPRLRHTAAQHCHPSQIRRPQQGSQHRRTAPPTARWRPRRWAIAISRIHYRNFIYKSEFLHQK